jgi:tetratricopeptide (TPR) repeat protein
MINKAILVLLLIGLIIGCDGNSAEQGNLQSVSEQSDRELVKADSELSKHLSKNRKTLEYYTHVRLKGYQKEFAWIGNIDADMLLCEARWHEKEGDLKLAAGAYGKALKSNKKALVPVPIIGISLSDHGITSSEHKGIMFALQHPWLVRDAACLGIARIHVEEGRINEACRVLEKALMPNQEQREYSPEKYSFVVRSQNPSNTEFKTCSEKGVVYEWTPVKEWGTDKLIRWEKNIYVKALDDSGFIKNAPDKEMIRLLAKLYTDRKETNRLMRLKEHIEQRLPRLACELFKTKRRNLIKDKAESVGDILSYYS